MDRNQYIEDRLSELSESVLFIREEMKELLIEYRESNPDEEGLRFRRFVEKIADIIK